MFLQGNMRILREIHGKTLEEVARELKVDKATVSRIERGARGADPSYVAAFCRLFWIEEGLLQSRPLSVPVQIATSER